MEFSEKIIRKQLEMMKPITSTRSLETIRKAQDRLGSIMTKLRRRQVTVTEIPHSKLSLALAAPNDERKDGAVLYIHGGGYTCGSLDYAKGFASVLAGECGIKTYCLAYRLAPENPFPAAVDDVFDAYRYLLSSGVLPEKLILCGESAGGGLCYSLCIRLKAARLPLPAGIIAISPWTDITQSGESLITNADVDPSLSKETLDSYSKCYTDTPEDPLCSPLFADLSNMPPSLIFVGGDEVLLDDSKRLHEKLIESGSVSELRIADKLWHAYVLYCLKEHMDDFRLIDEFIVKNAAKRRKLRWMRLDNAAKIYPAAKRRNWNNFFRLSATLTEEVDREVLKSAMDITMRRFPSIAVRLCRGMFWYYLEELSESPEISEEKPWPLAHTPFESINKCALRVIVYNKRIAVEFYHALTDGNGGIIFLKSLIAEYLEQKHGISIPCEKGVFDRLEQPHIEEFEDSFSKNVGTISAKRNASTVYRIRCTPERSDMRHLTTFIFDTQQVLDAAKSHGVSLTVFLTGAMLFALQALQDEQIPDKRKQKPLRVVVPVNLRTLFGSKTLRNFVHVVMPEIDPRMGDYSIEEILSSVKHQLGVLITKKNLQSMFTPNVNAERNPVLRLMPLFVKNIAMKMVYDTVGERTNCLNLSNLGAVDLPDIMKEYVERFDFVLGVQATKPNNCGIVSYNGKLYMNFIRNTVESCLEKRFYDTMRSLGIVATVESNLSALIEIGHTKQENNDFEIERKD